MTAASPNALRVYLDRAAYDPSDRPNLNDIPKELWKAARGAGSVPGITDSFCEVSLLKSADFALLPMKWNYYVDRGRETHLVRLCEEARQWDKKVAVISAGDFGARLPVVDPVRPVLLQCTVYRSRRLPHEYAMPPFHGDRLHTYLDGALRVRRKSGKPVLSFCGQAAPSRLRQQGRSLRLWGRRRAHELGLRKWPPPPFEHTVLRQRCLDAARASSDIATNLVIRDRYQGGTDLSDPMHPLRLEFIGNLVDSDYALCVRGAGNWSLRFYEALCLGRIPVLIDTDCMLPFEDVIDWKRLCVWIPATQLATLGQRIHEFHDALSDGDFVALQHECRQVWQTYLSVDGFYRNMHRYLTASTSKSGRPSVFEPPPRWREPAAQGKR
jgi:hypothetical protein